MNFSLTTAKHGALQRRDELFTQEPAGIESKRSLIAVLWRRKYLFGCLCLSVFTALVAAALWLPKQYLATSLLAYDIRPMRSVLGALSQPSVGEEVVAGRVDATVLASEADIIMSRATIMHMLAAAPTLAESPTARHLSTDSLFANLRRWFEAHLVLQTRLNAVQEQIIERISRHLSATVPQTSSLIRVSYSADDPEYAAKVVNAIVSVYLQDQVQAKRAAISGTIGQLQVRLLELGRQVVTADQAVQDFRSENGLLKTVGTPANMQQLSEVSLLEARTRADLAAAQTRLDSLKAMPPYAVAVLQPGNGPGTESAHSLMLLEGDIRHRLSEAEGKWLHSSPQYVLLEKQLAGVHRLLEHQGTLIVQNSEADVRASRGRLTELLAVKSTTSADIQRENALDSQLLRLTAEAQSARASYDTFLTGSTRVSMLENTQVPDVRVVDIASPSIRPAISLIVIIALLLPISAICSAAIIVMLQRLRAGMALTDREFERTYHLPVLGVTSYLHRRRRCDFDRWATNHARHMSCADRGLCAYTDDVRGIRNMVDLHLPDSDCQSVAVVSAISGEGKSVLAISLAAAWAASGRSTLVIDCDFQHPTLHRLIDDNNEVGLASFLRDQVPATEVVKRVSKGFDIVSSGTSSGRAFYDFGEVQLRGVLAAFGDGYDRILLDLPPIMTGPDGIIGAVVSNLTLFVSRWEGTPQVLTEAALERLRMLNVKHVAAILTQVDMKKYRSELGIAPYLGAART